MEARQSSDSLESGEIRAAYDVDGLNARLDQALARIQLLEQQLDTEREARVQQAHTIGAIVQDGEVLAQQVEQVSHVVQQPQSVHVAAAGTAAAEVQRDVGDGIYSVGVHAAAQNIQQHATDNHSQAPKVEVPKPFTGKPGDTDVDTWIYQMCMYFAAEGRISAAQRTVRAALNLDADASVWFRAQGWDPTSLPWTNLQEALRNEFRPADFDQRARDILNACQQTGPVTRYTTAFRRARQNCKDVGDAEARYRYIAGLKDEARQWVRMHNPGTLSEAAQIAERYDATYHTRKGKQPQQQQVQVPRGQKPQGKPQGKPQPRDKGKQKAGFRGECFVCHQTGHRAADCPKKAKLQALLAEAQSSGN